MSLCKQIHIIIFVQRGRVRAETVSEDDLREFQSVEGTGETMAGKSKVKGRDKEHYIPHVPSDYHSEKGLSVVGGSFDRDAASAVLDLGGDEGEGRKTEKMKW